MLPGRVGQSVMLMIADACLTADPVVTRSLSARSHTFVQIDHEINSTVILLPSLIQEDLLSVINESMCMKCG